MAKPRILLVDDHTLVADGLRGLLEPEFEVVATISDPPSLFSAAHTSKPDIVLLDVYPPFVNDLGAGRKLKAAHPSIKIIILTTNDEPDTAAENLNQWASGYLHMKSRGAELVKAIRDVLRGVKYVTPFPQMNLAEAQFRRPWFGVMRALTPREQEVLKLLAGGSTMKEVAATLQIATRTVAFHNYRIMRDFGIKTNVELFRFAIKKRVLDPD